MSECALRCTDTSELLREVVLRGSLCPGNVFTALKLKNAEKPSVTRREGGKSNSTLKNRDVGYFFGEELLLSWGRRRGASFCWVL